MSFPRDQLVRLRYQFKKSSHSTTISHSLFDNFQTVLTLDMDGTNMSTSLKAGDYFGQEVMGQGDKQYMTTVVTESKTTCWKIEKSTITRTMKKIEAMQSGSNKVAGL